MDHIFFALCCTLLLSGCGSVNQPQIAMNQSARDSQNKVREMDITVTAINTQGVVGTLGIPMGKVVTIEATMVDGDTLKTKAATGQWLIKVSKVDGVTLNKPVIIEHKGIKMNPTKHGAPVQLVGYETGQFTGLPKGAAVQEAVATKRYHFAVYFSVLRQK